MVNPYSAPLTCVALPQTSPLSAEELGQVIPAIYGRSPVLPLYQWWEAPWQLPQEHAKARCGFTPTHLCFYLYMVDADVISYATANDQKMCVQSIYCCHCTLSSWSMVLAPCANLAAWKAPGGSWVTALKCS